MHKILIFLFTIAPCLLFTAVKPSLAADDGQTHFRFGIVTPRDSFLSVLQSKILMEAFRRNGWELDIQYYADNTKLVRLVEMGLIDGEVLRESTFADNGMHPGYVKVAVETVAGESGAYATADLPISDWKSLAELNRPVGFVLAEIFNATPAESHYSPGKPDRLQDPARRFPGAGPWRDTGLRHGRSLPRNGDDALSGICQHKHQTAGYLVKNRGEYLFRQKNTPLSCPCWSRPSAA